MRRTSVLLFVAAVAMGMSSVVYADTVIFSQNFDNLTTNSNAYRSKTTGSGDSTTTDGLWRAAGQSSSATTSALCAVPDFTQSVEPGGNSVRIHRPSSGGRGELEGFTTITGSPYTTGQIQVEAWLREEVDASGFMSTTTLDIANQVGTTTITGPPFEIYTGRTSSAFNSLNVYDSVAAAWVDTGKAIPTDQSWFGVRLIADLDTGLSSAYINYGLGGGWEVGVQGVAGLTGSIGAGAQNCVYFDPSSAFDSSGNSSNSGSTWIDDVVLQILNPVVPGDYNGNGVVDAADYVSWRKDPASHGGDPDGYTAWRANFGAGSGAGSGAGLGSATVPEPAAALLLALGAGVLSIGAGTRRRQKAVSRGTR